MYFTYILRCRDGSLYTGVTNDLKRRLDQHNRGKASRYTRSRLPARYVYIERRANKSDALKRECEIKRLSKKNKEKLVSEFQSIANDRFDC